MRKTLSLVLAAVMALALLLPGALAEVTYPLDTDAKITWWVSLNSNVSATSKDMNVIPYAAALIEATGVDIEFVHPASGQEQEQFNLMIASGKMTDIVEGSWLGWYPSGMDVAIENGLAYPLNDVLADLAPDFNGYLESDAKIDKLSKTDTGNYYGFTFFMIEDILLSASGPFIRVDWLEDLGLEKPTTLDEWEVVLTAFRDEKGATAPWAGQDAGMGLFWSDAVFGAYGVAKEYYQVDGVVKYGPLEPGYKEAVARMAQWYAEGLIDPNFLTNKSAERDALIMNEEAGVTYAYAQSGMNRLNLALQELNPDARFESIPYPVLEEGQRAMFGQKSTIVNSTPVTVVNPNSENLETVIKTLNFGYTEAGYYLNNFGIEGVSYDMVDGLAIMKDSVLNPTDCTIGQEWSKYARAPYSGPFEQSGQYMRQFQSKDELREALATWADTDDSIYRLPSLSRTVDEGKIYTQIANDAKAIIDEWVTGAIMGVVDMADFESAVVEELKAIGIEEAIAIQQAALDRFNAR